MNSLKIEINFHHKRWIEGYNNPFFNDSETKYFIGFPFSINLDSNAAEMMIIPNYSISMQSDNNDALKKTLFLNAIENLKNRNKIDIFKGIINYSLVDIEIKNELELNFDTYLEFSIEINDELFESLCSQFKENHLIYDRFRIVVDFLTNMNNSQIDSDKELVRSCFNYLFDCLKASNGELSRISDLESIFNCFLFDKKDIKYFRRQLSGFYPPKLYESKPNLPQEIDGVF